METPWDWNGPIKISVIPALPAVLLTTPSLTPYRPLLGDGVLDVNLVSTDFTDGWQKIGPAIRDTLNADSRHGMTAMTGSNGLQFVWRLNPGAGSSDSTRPGLTPPKMLQIEKSGDLITSRFFGEWFPGLPWTWLQIGTPQTILMSSESYIGLVVCSHNNGALNTAVFDSLTLTAPPVEFPWNLSPEDGAVGVSLTPTLDWIGGDSATSWDVYFGTDPGALPLVGTVADSEYTPAALAANTTYYWQVVDQPSGVASAVMSFSSLYEAPWYTGSTVREVWLGMWWAAPIERLLWGDEFLNKPANWVDVLPNLDTPDLGIGDYGARLSGHLIPGTSGDYTFWAAADDAVELRLNTSDDGVANMERLAYHNDWSGYAEWDKFGTQKSRTIPLVAGQKYYAEILFKEGGGGDHAEAGWEGPDSPSRSVINPDYLTAAFARTPKPKIRETVTPLEVETLDWAPGIHCTEQEVLFGTDPGAMVAIATALPGDATSIVAPAVASDTTYYWQVNCTDGTDTWAGDVWSFTVSDWVGRNIGQRLETPSGSSSYDPVTDVTVMNATGHELWGDFDEFHFRYTTMKMTRDKGAIQARILSITPDHWRRAGVMIRETLASTSRKFMMHKTGHDNTRMQRRDNTRNGTGSGPDAWGLGFPLWLRIERDGSNFNAYHSFDGETWIHRGYRWIPMEAGKPVHLGLATCNHPNAGLGNMTTATFDSLSITTPDARQAWNLQPPNGSTMVDIHATLSWSPGDGATEHRVYFSADEEAVINRTVDPIILPAETTSVEVGPLTLGTVYYWAVDELVNPVIPGEVVSFTAEEYRTIDDFESYDVEPEALPEQIFVPGNLLVEAVAPPEQTEIPGYTIPGYTIEAVEPDTGCLVAHYEFEMNADDSTANANHGTVYGDPGYVPGPVSFALECDATNDHNDYVIVPDSASLSFGTDSFSIACWIKSTRTGGDKEFIVKNGSAGSEFGGKPDVNGPNSGKRYVLKFEGSNDFRFAIDDDDDKTVCTAARSDIATGDWVQVTAIRNTADDKLYIYADGVLVAEKGDGTDTSIDSPGEIMTIAAAQKENGTYAGEIGHWFTGGLDDMRFYNCALTEGNARFLAGVGDKIVPPVVVPPSYEPMLAHWALDSDMTDSSGHGFDGTAVGDATLVSDPDRGQVLSLDGDGDWVNCGNPDLLNFGTVDWTICAWVKNTMTGTGDSNKGSIVANGGDGGGGKRYCLIQSEQREAKVTLVTDDNSKKRQARANTTLVNDDVWHHVLGLREGGQIRIYIDGVQEGSSSINENLSGTSQRDFLIGAIHKQSDGSKYKQYTGLIDDVRVYNYALSEGEARYLAEVGDLWENGIPDRYYPMVAHFEFEGNLDDSTGNNYHGTAHGAVGFEIDLDMGSVLDLPGGSNQYVSVPPVGISGNDPTTIACWAKADHTSIPDWTLIFGFTGNAGGGGGCGSHFNIGSIGGPQGVGAHAWCWEETIFNDTDALDWRHYAMTYDGSKIEYYGNGQLMDTDLGKSNVIDLSARADRVHIGSRVTQDSSFPGNVEDARVYNIALTAGQIATLGGYVPTNPLSDTWSGRAAAVSALEYTAPAHEGDQSMRVEYTGSGAVSRLEPFGDGKHPHGWNGDFSLATAQALSLWFKGDPSNAPGMMFAQLTTVVPSGHTQRVIYDGDPEDLQKPIWQEWSMSLKALSTGKPADPIGEMGLPITKIKDVGVGIIGAGSGTLYFDDLRLYPTRCVPKYGPRHDLNGDCVV
ncbi:MAG: LamG-like jellyroll fold domain-containing protein, partial [Planctomycetota bacterium]